VCCSESEKSEITFNGIVYEIIMLLVLGLKAEYLLPHASISLVRVCVLSLPSASYLASSVIKPSLNEKKRSETTQTLCAYLLLSG